MFNDHSRPRYPLEQCILQKSAKFACISDTKIGVSKNSYRFCRSQLWGSSIRDAELDEIESILHILALATCDGRLWNRYLSSEIPLKQIHKERNNIFWRG